MALRPDLFQSFQPSIRLLYRQPLDTEALWQEAKAFVDKKKGLLVLNDTTLDESYAKKIELVIYHLRGHG